MTSSWFFIRQPLNLFEIQHKYRALDLETPTLAQKCKGNALLIFCDFSILITLLTLPIFYKKIHLVPHREHGIHTVRTGFCTKEQKNVYIVDSFINLHIIHTFQPNVISVLGQRRNYTQYKLFCTLTTTLKRTAHCCISIVKLVSPIRYNVTLYVHFPSRYIPSCPFFSWILVLYYFLILLFIPFFSYNLRRKQSIR